MKRVNATALTLALGVLFVLIYTGRQAAANPATDVSDLEQIRGMGNAFSLYHKKYNHYPALMDPTKATAIGEVRKKGNCLALKLLLSGGFIDDAKQLFSPRNGPVDAETLKAISKELDPTKDTTFACAYAYDAGHTQTQGSAVFFGSEPNWFQNNADDNAHVLQCNATVQSIERNETSKKYVVSARAPGKTASIDDDLYADDSAKLMWNDSCLTWDVSNVVKPPAKAAK